MPDSPTSQLESHFVCDCGEWEGSACAGEAFYKEHEGKRYCVLHFPSREKSADFEAALQRKLENKDFNFRGGWFPDEVSFAKFDSTAAADFSSATFSADVYFSYATFSAEAYFSSTTFSAAANFDSATFSADVYFSSATFGAAADFSSATFSAAADFSSATFNADADFRSAAFRAAANFRSATFSADADFGDATFSADANFRSATFSADADFSYATFSASANFRSATFSAVAYFTHAAFRDYVEFSGSETNQTFSATSSLDLQFGKIDKPDRVSFHTLTLDPHWFVNVDPRKFDFTNVKWKNSGEARPELELLKAKRAADVDPDQETEDKSSHRLLSQACQRLAANCEENARYRKASHFRRMALDAERLETWHGFDVRKLNWWYWLASGYGERPFQALLVLIGMLVLFGFLYTKVGFARWEPRLANEADAVAAKRDDVGAPLPFKRALTYSAGVLTFQRPEPKPATSAGHFLVLLETILGPVQAALLALAIRRKFMR